MSVYLKAPGDLAESDRAILRRLASNLNLLADLSHADVLLLCRDGDEALVVAEGRPAPVPSIYLESQLGRRLSRAEAPGIHRVLFEGKSRQHFGGVLRRGMPTMQEVFGIRNDQGETIVAVSSEMPMLEHERLRKRSALYRRAIAHVRESILEGLLEGGDQLGRLGVHDGVMVVDDRGIIQYVSAVAEHYYRRLGYADTLVKMQLAELETNEYICFRAMELGSCQEQRIQEQDDIWIKRVVPLLPLPNRGGLLRRALEPRQVANGALILVQDVTDEVRKEQELRIKSTMIQEIHHRVKNNLQTIAALLRLQARQAQSAEVAEQLGQTVSRILSIAVVHEFLSKDERAVINIHEVSNRILDEVKHGTLDPSKQIHLRLEGAKQFCLPAQQATSCALIINELLQNAVEHGYQGRQEGTILVRLTETDDSMSLEIADDGEGLPHDFDVERYGLGLRIVGTLVREDLKGQFVLENGRGVRALVSFPRWRGDDETAAAASVEAAPRSIRFS